MKNAKVFKYHIDKSKRLVYYVFIKSNNKIIFAIIECLAIQGL